jgi:hypothetical protein
LKLPDFAALTVNLGAHQFDLSTDIIKLHDVLARLGPSRSAGEQPPPDDLPVREGAGGATVG